MICDRYVLYVCPDPDCEEWGTEPGRCGNYDEHTLGEYPDLIELVVRPLADVAFLRRRMERRA